MASEAMEIDMACDAVGIRLGKPPLLCGNCLEEMVAINPITKQCPRCGAKFDGKD
tara:strand:+ start:4680 stop:4844 length:165 start_codon:yes stop_codon:yes gene_type:complete